MSWLALMLMASTAFVVTMVVLSICGVGRRIARHVMLPNTGMAPGARACGRRACGTLNPPHASYCRKCGERLEVGESMTSSRAMDN